MIHGTQLLLLLHVRQSIFIDSIIYDENRTHSTHVKRREKKIIVKSTNYE